MLGGENAGDWMVLEEGLDELAVWLAEGHLPEDHVERARLELTRRGLAL